MRYTIAILAVIAFASCNKAGKYTCHCTNDVTGEDVIYPVPYGKGTSKKEATKSCNEKDKLYKNSNFAYSCKIN